MLHFAFQFITFKRLELIRLYLNFIMCYKHIFALDQGFCIAYFNTVYCNLCFIYQIEKFVNLKFSQSLNGVFFSFSIFYVWKYHEKKTLIKSFSLEKFFKTNFRDIMRYFFFLLFSALEKVLAD